MNNIMHDHLNKLRIISKIRAGQRLDTTPNGFTVYEESMFNWLTRNYYHDSKDTGVRYLQDLYKSIDQSAEQLITEIKSFEINNKRTRRIYTAINLAEKIKQSITGIENLSKTYIVYPKITATLEGIIQDFALETYKQLLDVIPVIEYTKSLKENITYNGSVLYIGQNNLNPISCLDINDVSSVGIGIKETDGFNGDNN